MMRRAYPTGYSGAAQHIMHSMISWLPSIRDIVTCLVQHVHAVHSTIMICCEEVLLLDILDMCLCRAVHSTYHKTSTMVF